MYLRGRLAESVQDGGAAGEDRLRRSLLQRRGQLILFQLALEVDTGQIDTDRVLRRGFGEPFARSALSAVVVGAGNRGA